MLPTLGFHLRVLRDCSLDLPQVNSYIYAHWDDVATTEPKGRYLVKVTSLAQTERPPCFIRRVG